MDSLALRLKPDLKIMGRKYDRAVDTKLRRKNIVEKA